MRGPWKKSATKGDRAWRMAVDCSLDKERSAGLRRVITPMVARSISQSNHSGAHPHSVVYDSSIVVGLGCSSPVIGLQ